MYDITEIEAQWRKYKRKKILIPSGILLLVILLLGVAWLFWPEQSVQAHDTGKGAKVVNLSPVTPVSHNPDKSVPEHTPPPSTRVPLSTEVPSVAQTSQRKKGWHMTFEGEASKKANTTPPRKSLRHIDIHVSAKKNTLTVQEMEKRFRLSQDKDDSLFLARYYLDKKQYSKALDWALETNKLDSDIEESWLIFARAKARMGQRMEAIRVLQAYFDRSGSPKAKDLLDKIRRGKRL